MDGWSGGLESGWERRAAGVRGRTVERQKRVGGERDAGVRQRFRTESRRTASLDR